MEALLSVPLTPTPILNDTPTYNWTHAELFDDWIYDLNTPDIPTGETDHFDFDIDEAIDEPQPSLHNPDETEDLQTLVDSLIPITEPPIPKRRLNPS